MSLSPPGTNNLPAPVTHERSRLVSGGGISSFERAYRDWKERGLTQEEAARLLGVSTRTFRRHIIRYETSGRDGLLDKRKTMVSHRRAPADEALWLVERYRRSHKGWKVRRFYAWYRRDGGTRSYSWVKNTLQAAGVVNKARRSGARQVQRVRQEQRKPAHLPGLLLHQDGRTHEWAPGRQWTLVVTLDDATGEHYSLFFCETEGTHSSFRGVREVIEAKGLFCSLYTDRASHYRRTHEARGEAYKPGSTQFGRAMKQLGIEMIAAHPAARRPVDEAFAAHRERLPGELAAAGITDVDAANAWLRDVYLPAFNAEFAAPSPEDGSAFMPCPASVALDDILCEQFERTVGKNNVVRFGGRVLRVPAAQLGHHVRPRVKVCRHAGNVLSLFLGPRRLARYDAEGRLMPGTLSG